ncbi:MAG: hypothetical protein KC421_30745, partial [Anaerolineales bacterium]|nr:hypothetical protein [Anaerolineales bacterium]
MINLHQKHTRSGWNGRFLKLALLTTLILVITSFATGSSQPAAAQESPGPAWIFQGPAPQLGGPAQDLANVPQPDEPVSGAVAAIAAGPNDPDLVYLGAANGGVWKTTNATDPNPTWTPLTDHLQSQSIGLDALDLDPLDITDQTLLVGTGRFSGYANRGDDQVGIYYTTDGGASWTVSTDPQLSAKRITGVAARGNTMLVASEGGLFRTTDGVLGTWTKISGSGGLPAARAADITPDPNDTNRFYVTFTGASGGLFRTDDLGATWTDITGNITGITARTNAFEVAVFNDGATSVVSVVLNGVGNDADANAIFRSANGGAFTALDVPDVFRNAYGKFGLTADKTNPDLIYVSGGYAILGSNPFLATTYRIDASQPGGSQLTHLYGAVSTNLLLPIGATQTYMYVGSIKLFPETTPFVVTIDNEQITVDTVTKPGWYYQLFITRGANGTTPTAHGYAPVHPLTTYGAPHVDINHLATDANGSLLMGAHGGIFALAQPDSASSTTTNTWLSKNGNLGVTEMHDIAYDPVTNTLIGGNQDNAVVFQSAPGNHIWPVAPGSSGDGGDVAVADLGNGQSVRYISTQNLGNFTRLVYDADNNQVSKTTLSTSVISDKQFTTPIAVNAVDPNRLLIGGSYYTYESMDQGTTINRVATVGVFHRAIAYGGRKDGIANPDVFYVAESGSTIYARTTAGGALTTYRVPGALDIRDIVMNPEDWMHVFAIDKYKVFVTTDGGATWTDIAGDLLSISSSEISTVEFISGSSPYIAVGTRSGVFASKLDALGSWVELGIDLPDVLVYELDYDATDDVLAAAALGRGAWLLPDASEALAPTAVAPLLTLSGPTATDEGSTLTYAFTVDDPNDTFTVTTLTVGGGGSLVPDSLSTTELGGSFQVSFDDGPATVDINLQVTDSTALTSNTETASVTVSNVAPSPSILGAPTSGSVGTPVNLTGDVTDPSTADTAAGFDLYWLVQKSINGSTVTYTDGRGTTFSYTPDETATYHVWLTATDKDGGNSQTDKVITAALSDLTIDTVSVTVSEGQTAVNSGTYAYTGAVPPTFVTSSVPATGGSGTVTTTPATPSALNNDGYWQLGEDDPLAVAGEAGKNPTRGRDENWQVSTLRNLSVFSGAPTYTDSVPPNSGSVLAMSFDGASGYGMISRVVTAATDNFGIEAWVRPGTGGAAVQSVLQNGGGAGTIFVSGFGIVIKDGTYHVLYGDGSANGALYDTGVAAIPDEWHDVA